MALRSRNPVLNAKTFERYAQTGVAGETMTVEGTVNKAALLLFLVVAAAAWPWYNYFSSGGTYDVLPLLMGGALIGFVVGLVTTFAPSYAALTAPIYAVCEGLALGSLSALLEQSYHGIVVQAVSLTFAVFAVMLIAYRARLIRATEKFKMVVITATASIALLYLVDLALVFFAGWNVPFIHESGTIGILFSLFVVGLASLNLILDFSFIEEGVTNNAPKMLEWYGAFGLLVTLVWLYLEILRLLAKLRRR
jgi:uncharacterized YccA/Bax inhibitor family protein